MGVAGPRGSFEELPIRQHLLPLIRRHGWNATSFQVLEPGYRYWIDDDAFVAYFDTGAAWVAAGAPIAPPERLAQVAFRFTAAARAAGRRACFFSTERRFVEATRLPSLLIGEQPVWDPAAWDETLRGSRRMREQLRRARAKGVRVVPLDAAAAARDPALRASCDRLAARWMGGRTLAPMGFLVQLDPWGFAAEKRYFVAERDGAAVAFLVGVPVYARGGWLLEDLVRDPAAPNGTSELLIDAAMRAAREAGVSWATLGLAPLAGPVHPLLRLARRCGVVLYDFGGIHAFRARLRPQSWDPVYLTRPERGAHALAVFDSLSAFARGRLWPFAMETLRRVLGGILRRFDKHIVGR